MKFSYKTVLLSAILATTSVSSIAATYAYRNTDMVDITNGGPAAISTIVVYTDPVLANQPVYSSREHWKTWNHTSTPYPGTLGYQNTYIGVTDANGVYTFEGNIPNNSIYCGKFKNETFSVGAPNASKSAALTFYIYRSSDFGPIDQTCVIDYMYGI